LKGERKKKGGGIHLGRNAHRAHGEKKKKEKVNVCQPGKGKGKKKKSMVKNQSFLIKNLETRKKKPKIREKGGGGRRSSKPSPVGKRRQKKKNMGDLSVVSGAKGMGRKKGARQFRWQSNRMGKKTTKEGARVSLPAPPGRKGKRKKGRGSSPPFLNEVAGEGERRGLHIILPASEKRKRKGKIAALLSRMGANREKIRRWCACIDVGVKRKKRGLVPLDGEKELVLYFADAR